MTKYVVKATREDGRIFLLSANPSIIIFGFNDYEHSLMGVILWEEICHTKTDIYCTAADFIEANKKLHNYETIDKMYNIKAPKKEHYRYKLIPIAAAIALLEKNSKVPKYRERYKKVPNPRKATAQDIARKNHHITKTRYKDINKRHPNLSKGW